MRTAIGSRPPRSWELPPVDSSLCETLVRELGISHLLARLLLNRGIETPDIAHGYLNPSLSDLPSPFALCDMEPAVQRLLVAIDARERICIYGDYDMDGVSGAAVLVSFLRHYGADVEPFIPHRERDGYGLQRSPLERIIRQGARLVITCDNGTSAFEEILFARANGVDVIVTDHHSLPDQLPPATAVLNPLRRENPPVFRVLAGAGVAFMLVLALRKRLRECDARREHPNLKRYLDLVALGTVADVVPLVGINRILVRFGLDELRKRSRPGLRALMDSAGVQAAEEITATTVGYRLAPRLNAAGRLGDATDAINLLLTDDPREASRLAGELEVANRRRQQLEEAVLADIRSRLATTPSVGTRYSYVFASPDWHPGVVGIVAARVAEMTQRPGLVLSVRENEAKGSGRSVPGFDLVRALRDCSTLLLRYGGHKMAAGLSVHVSNLEAFSEQFERAAGTQLSGAVMSRTLAIDAELQLSHIDDTLTCDIDRLKPYGAGNPEPIFASSELLVLEHRVVGRGHLRLRLAQGGRTMPGIGFRMGALSADLSPGSRIRIAYCPQFNYWRGERTVQLNITDLVPES